jgi:arginine-tRNA-protein transferase
MAQPLACFPPHGVMQPILEHSEIDSLPARRLDLRLVTGWRHFGTRFFRYNFALHEGALCGVVPLRLRVEAATLTKSQRRIWRRNGDLSARIVPTTHCAEYDRLFALHRERFASDAPDSLRDFLSATPAEIPCLNMTIEVRLGAKLVAASFLDIGLESTSSVYGMFDPEHSRRSLGIHTLLLELAFARQLGKRFHYLGYAYTVPSVYDYKKRFLGVEGYDWGRCWMPLPRDLQWSRDLAPLEAAAAAA